MRLNIRYILISSAAGILAGLSFNSPILSFLVWVAFIPLFYLLRRRAETIFFYFFLAGFFNYMVSIFWVGLVTKLGFLTLLFYLSLWWGIFGVLSTYLWRRPLRIITIPFLWVILEFIREHALSGFGWGILGYSQHKTFFLIQTADILGTKFISFLIITFNLFLFELTAHRRRTVKLILYVAVLLLACLSYSSYRLYTLAQNRSPVCRVAVVQPSIEQAMKWDTQYAFPIINRLKALGKAPGPGHLIIYPEASWPFVVNGENYPLFKRFMEDLDRDVLMGAIVEEGGEFYNTASLFSATQPAQVYKKVRLVPFGEYVPFRKYLDFIDIINTLSDITPGSKITRFRYRDKTFAVLICFEDIFPHLVRQACQRSDFLVNITNDAWFGGNPEAQQHVAIMTMRAVENRIPIVRAANTGISGWVSPQGKMHAYRLEDQEVFVEGFYGFTVPIRGGETFYNRWGDKWLLCALIFLPVFVWRKR